MKVVLGGRRVVLVDGLGRSFSPFRFWNPTDEILRVEGHVGGFYVKVLLRPFLRLFRRRSVVVRYRFGGLNLV